MPTTTIATHGSGRRKARPPTITTSDPMPIASAVALVTPSRTPSTNPRTSSTNEVASMEKPNSLGS